MADVGPLEAADQRGPIFIIGAMGSGTTLLRLMLDSHPNIAIPHETAFMRAYMAHKFIPFKYTGRRWAQRMGWSDEELDRELSAFYERIFMRYAELHGKQRWGEKTPSHTWHIDAMARLFPDAVFVAIVRHPGASVASNITRFDYKPRQAARHYDRYNREIARQAARHADRFVLLRYEELVLKSEPVMKDLLDWLDEPWSESVLEHHVVQSQREHKRVEGKTRAGDRIDASRIDKWMQQLDEPTKRMLQQRIGRLAEFYGYSVQHAGALQPLATRESLLVRGAEIDERIERFPELDLRTRPRVGDLEHYYDPRRFRLAVNDTGEREPEHGSRGQHGAPVTPLLHRMARPAFRRLPPGARRRVRRAVERLARRG